MSIAEMKLDASLEAFILQNVVRLLPEPPSQRELLIQNDKLLRMSMKVERTHLLGGGSAKKMRKRWEQEAREISAQTRRVRGLAEKFFKEFLRQRGSLTNADYRAWKAKFDVGVSINKDKMKKQVYEKIAALSVENMGFLPRKRHKQQ